MGGAGGNTIEHEGRTPEYMATGGNQGERPRHREVGKLVSIIQVAFREEYIPEVLTWMVLVIVPNGGGG